MTQKICLLGNSHLAALRDALSRTPDRWRGTDFTCIGGHDETLLETTCADGVLRPSTAKAKAAFADFGGVDAVPLDAFDLVVVVGCQVACARAGALYRRARWFDLPSVARRADVADAPWALVSMPAFAAGLRDMLATTLGIRLLAHLRQGSTVPMALTSQPRITTQIHAMVDHPLAINRQIIAAGDGQAVSDMFEATANRIVDEHEATFLSQPTQTITEHLLTKDPFTKGAVRLTRQGRTPQPQEDLLHANAAYGQLVLDQIAAHVTT